MGRAYSPKAELRFFLSDGWVSTWLEVYGEELTPKILFFQQDLDAQVVGACLLIRSVFWQGFIPVRRVYLNCAGESEGDSTCIEYNRLLCLPGHAAGGGLGSPAVFTKRLVG